jgi:uncharacterized cupin superfamily protein
MTKPSVIPSVIKVSDIPVRTGSSYPPEFAKHVGGRSGQALGNPFDLTQFGVNIITLQPGAWSSHRHWHEQEDELVYALSGKMVLIDDHGRHAFLPGMCAGFKANNGNGHHIINETHEAASFLVVGTRAENEVAHYSDVDMHGEKTPNGFVFTRKDGSPI